MSPSGHLKERATLPRKRQGTKRKWLRFVSLVQDEVDAKGIAVDYVTCAVSAGYSREYARTVIVSGERFRGGIIDAII